MIQETTHQKQVRGKHLTDPKLVIKARDLLYPVFMLLTGTKVHYRIESVNDYHALPGKPIIFAANHFAFPDIPVVLRTTKRRSYIFAGKQRLAFIDWFFFAMNGTIWVDRKDKADMAASKDGIVARLNIGQSVLWFPEGTWNLTENQLMLPMKWGIVDVAREAGAQVIPVGLDYDRENKVCKVRFGEPRVFDAQDDKAQAIAHLRDAMATMRWNFMEERGVYRRRELDFDEERKALRYSIEEYPPIDWAYEESCIFKPWVDVQEVFAHLEQIKPILRNAFLWGAKEK